MSGRPTLSAEQRSLEEVLRQVVLRLREARIPNAEGEARELLAAALGCAPLSLFLKGREPLPETATERVGALLEERLRRRPLAYVLGEWSFLDLRLRVTEDVLIPRPETEELLEWAAQTLARESSAGRSLGLADVGTGAGGLALALARRFPEALLWATDVSTKALAVARENAARHGLSGRVRFLEGDLLSPLLSRGQAFLDGVLANLPYVASDDMPRLEPEVLWEPRLALDGGAGGLEIVRRFLPQALRALRPGGTVFLEAGLGQASVLARDMAGAGFQDVRTEKDMNGILRFLQGTKPR